MNSDRSNSKAPPRFPDILEAGFADDTRVWTDKGPVYIDRIQPGNLVLSKHENGMGEQAYKRVTKVLVHHDQEIGQMVYWDSEYQNDLHLTEKQLIWTKGKGWQPMVRVSDDVLELADGTEGWAVEINYMFCSRNDPKIGWSYSDVRNVSQYHFGTRIRGLASEVEGFFDHEYTHDGKTCSFKTTVYKLEVEDFHTYYVGDPGVWVHS